MICHAPGRRLSEHNMPVGIRERKAFRPVDAVGATGMKLPAQQTRWPVDDATRAAIAAAVARLAIAAAHRRHACRTGRAKPISGRLSFFTKD